VEVIFFVVQVTTTVWQPVEVVELPAVGIITE
jgi:hypothetical protein